MYNPKEIDAKWQKKWEESGIYKTPADVTPENKMYILPQLPYPSGSGLHMGHVAVYMPCDVYARYQRMQGKKVLQVIGWDSFGLPAENYAIKTNVHPRESTESAINNFRHQIKSLGISVDWDREVASHHPDYYKWTQWFFLLMYKQGLVYRKKQAINWCEQDKTVLANEQVEDGTCERCGTVVIQKEMEQWYLRITDYADRLIDDLDKVDWPAETVKRQRDWIGRSEGAEIDFRIKDTEEKITVFTTRPDTIFGATYVVLAPENQLVQDLQDKIENWDDVAAYIEETTKKTELDRQIEQDKTGIKLKGIHAINPLNGEEIPVWVADYVLASYGTGAVMAVPAHDERDYAFAKKFDLPIKQVVAPFVKKTLKEGVETLNRRCVDAIIEHPEGGKFLVIEDSDGSHLVGGGVEEGETIEEALAKEIREESGYINFDVVSKVIDQNFCEGYRSTKDKNQITNSAVFYVKLRDEERIPSEIEEGRHRMRWVEKDNVGNDITSESHAIAWNLFHKDTAFTDEGKSVNSDFLTDLSTAEAKKAILKHLEDHPELGRPKVQYKLRDWSISRQRFWGAPVPMLYDENGDIHPVPEEDLPVMLPDDVDFKPTGESPLRYSERFHADTEEKYGKGWKREVDTLDTFMCSSWYYYRYIDPKNDGAFASPEALKNWMPVDFYIGGPEHVNGHLLYSRFFTKVLFDAGYIDFDEPFLVNRHQGLILGPDNRKMSKRWGNVVNPNDVVDEYGSDTARIYQLFMGPLEDTKPWNDGGVKGVRRFLDKVWKLQDFLQDDTAASLDAPLHKLIKKVGDDTAQLQCNTAIAKMMEFVNLAYKEEHIGKEQLALFLRILAPYGPHIAEEMWEALGNSESVTREPWPGYDESKLVERNVTVVVQVNGKVRAKLVVAADATQDEVQAAALAEENVQKWLDGKEPKKVIYVPQKLVSIVL